MEWNAVRKARRKLKKETGTIFKDWGGRTPIALIYPNSYYVGMSNLGFQIIYGLLNSYPDIVCERVFWEGDVKPGEPLISTESQRPLSDFAILAFSISYELDYFNVIQVLKASGAPPFAAYRDERHPLVIAGGPCITANPEPLAPFFDCFVIGEGETILPSFVESITQGFQSSSDELLRRLAFIPGVYVPTMSNLTSDGETTRQWARNIDDSAANSVILTPDTEFGSMYLVEIARGCGRGCRFCLAGYIFRPLRSRSLDSLLAQAKVGLQYKKRLGLVGAAVSDHPQLQELVTELRRMGAAISVSSLRISPLSDLVLESLAESGTHTITLAPEAGSERLRRIINKGVNQEDIFKAIRKVAQHNIHQLKLYFMIGLPMEVDGDIEEIAKLSLACQQEINRQRAGTRLLLNITPFVPKAATPFQWLSMVRPEVIEHRLALLKAGLRGKGITIRSESVDWSIVQGVLARGDSKLGGVLTRMPQNSLSAWRQALEACQLKAEDYIFRELSSEETLAWRKLDSGVEKKYLRLELLKARQGLETPPCPSSECCECGVC